MVDYPKLLHLPQLPDGYNMISADQPSNTSIDGVFIYCKKLLCVCNSEISDISDITYCKARVKNKKRCIAVACRSPGQISIKIDKFISNF